jgi:hypothetical protein
MKIERFFLIPFFILLMRNKQQFTQVHKSKINKTITVVVEKFSIDQRGKIRVLLVV